MIIDCHTHINNYHDETVESLRECLDNLQTAMRRNRVDIALVLTSYKDVPGRPSTRRAVEATREALGPYAGPDGVVMHDNSAWLVTARR